MFIDEFRIRILVVHINVKDVFFFVFCFLYSQKRQYIDNYLFSSQSRNKKNNVIFSVNKYILTKSFRY